MATHEKWLVVSNCQTVGLANALQAMLPGVEIDAADFGLLRANLDAFNAQMDQYSRIIRSDITPDVLPDARIDRIEHHVVVPELTFHAYHGDLVYLRHGDDWVHTPLGDYNSALVWACYRQGLSEADTLGRFTPDVIERCGYCALWEPERDRLVRVFAGFGIDIAADVRRWGRATAFMHSINHPRIDVMVDLARRICLTQGLTPIDPPVIPHDNLISGATYPVYPPIAEALGVPGSYWFKSGGSYRPFDLGTFIAGSFASYRRLPIDAITPHPAFARLIDHVATCI